MVLKKATDQTIQDAIDLLISQGRDVTTAAILSWLNTEGITAKASDVHDSTAWQAMVAQEKGQAAPAAGKAAPKAEPKPELTAAPAKKSKSAGHPTSKTTTKPQERPMPKKPAYPTKSCPKCAQLIHARSHSHPACGWVMDSKPAAAAMPASTKKVGRPKKVHTATGTGSVTLEDIQAVKALVDRIGANKVRDLAHVLV